jgi:hypothetical protein
MKILLFVFLFALQLTVSVNMAVAQTQQQQPIVMEDYALLLQLSPQTIRKQGEAQVHQSLLKDFDVLYAGYIKGQAQFVIRRSAVMASMEPLRERVSQHFPNESLRSITNVEYEKLAKNLTR